MRCWISIVSSDDPILLNLRRHNWIMSFATGAAQNGERRKEAAQKQEKIELFQRQNTREFVKNPAEKRDFRVHRRKHLLRMSHDVRDGDGFPSGNGRESIEKYSECKSESREKDPEPNHIPAIREKTGDKGVDAGEKIVGPWRGSGRLQTVSLSVVVDWTLPARARQWRRHSICELFVNFSVKRSRGDHQVTLSSFPKTFVAFLSLDSKVGRLF
jgi:hypothetical protein